MFRQSVRRLGISAVLSLILAAGLPVSLRASDMIPPGFDLFDPLLGSMLFVRPLNRLVAVVGVPLGTFNFPGQGTFSTGNADSILQRFVELNGSNATTGIQMLAMQLMSLDGSNLFFTLSGMASLGTMNVTFGPEPHAPCPPNGCFDWSLGLNFDVRSGSVSGPVSSSFATTLTVTSASWSHIPPAGTVLIPGVNFMLPCHPGEDCDFFPTGPFVASGTEGTSIIFTTATVPEPSTLILLGTGVAGLLIAARRRRAC